MAADCHNPSNDSTNSFGPPARADKLRPSARLPEAGEILGEFRLLAELGRGGIGRVFLAEQTFLAGRLTVLKVTPCANQEHLWLARLQHTHIVPLYSVRDIPERDLRCLCMPCLGGATLCRLLRTLQTTEPARRTGSDLVAALPASVDDPRLYWTGAGPNRAALVKASYVQAVCWIGVCLADALQYAHDQGLVHLDVKPANVLLTADFQPMLLDFHLAREPIRPQQAAPSWLGGTVGYMSPEQRAAIVACRTREPITVAVDARTDVYALGLVLAEMLHGRHRAESTQSFLAELAGPKVTAGLRAILARCLEDDPAARYPSAALLAEDLRRHLTDRPLIGVPNRSIIERCRKGWRRRPYMVLLTLAVLFSLGAVLPFGSLYLRQVAGHRQEAEWAIALAHRQMEHRQYADAVHSFDTADRHLDHVFFADATRAEVRHGRMRAARAAAIASVHQSVEQARYSHGDDLVAMDLLRKFDADCRALWSQRRELLDSDDPFDAETEQQLRRDLLDSAILWAASHVRLAAPAEADTARRQALQVLDEAEAEFGVSAALERQRQSLGAPPRGPDTTAPRAPWEFYTLGRALLDDGDLPAAAAAFARAVELQPDAFWPWYGLGQCWHRQHRSEKAAHAFTVCLALSPKSAVCHYNRALAHAAGGDAVAAHRDYDRALSLDPELGSAVLNRGALHLKAGRLAEAEADFRRALELNVKPAAAHYNRALLHEARQEAAAALRCVQRALQHEPNHQPSRDLQTRLLRVTER